MWGVCYVLSAEMVYVESPRASSPGVVQDGWHMVLPAPSRHCCSVIAAVAAASLFFLQSTVLWELRPKQIYAPVVLGCQLCRLLHGRLP
jgi:hypothetical protein